MNRPSQIQDESADARRSGGAALLAFIFFNFVASPLMILLISVVLGGIIAAAESWSFENGFLFIGGVVTGWYCSYI